MSLPDCLTLSFISQSGEEQLAVNVELIPAGGLSSPDAKQQSGIYEPDADEYEDGVEWPGGTTLRVTGQHEAFSWCWSGSRSSDESEKLRLTSSDDSSPSCVVDVTATSDGNAIRFVTLTSSNVASGVQSKRGPRSLGTVVYLYKGTEYVAECLPFSKVKYNGQLYDDVEMWLGAMRLAAAELEQEQQAAAED